MERFKLEICKFALLAEAAFGLALLAAVIGGGLSLLVSLLYGVVSLCCVDWLCRVLLPAAKAPASPAAAAPAVPVCHVAPAQVRTAEAVHAA